MPMQPEECLSSVLSSYNKPHKSKRAIALWRELTNGLSQKHTGSSWMQVGKLRYVVHFGVNHNPLLNGERQADDHILVRAPHPLLCYAFTMGLVRTESMLTE